MFFKSKPAAPPEPDAAPLPVVDPVSPASSSLSELSPEQMRERAAASKKIEAAFGEIVAVLMRSENFRQHTLADLEWLVLPAVLTGQFTLAEAQSRQIGLTSPVALILWAQVSPEIDQRLSENLDQPLRLQLQDWKSGDIPWVTAVAGDAKIVEAMFKTMLNQQWKDRRAKLRVRNAEGKTVIAMIDRAPPGGALSA